MKKIIVMTTLMVSFVSFAQKAKEENVPQVIRNSFKEKYPNAKNVKWDKEENNYEASFKNNGLDNSILLNAEGKVIETEIAISIDQLPKKALQYLSENYKGKKIKEAAKIINEKGKVVFEAEIKDKDLHFDEVGNFISKD